MLCGLSEQFTDSVTLLGLLQIYSCAKSLLNEEFESEFKDVMDLMMSP